MPLPSETPEYKDLVRNELIHLSSTYTQAEVVHDEVSNKVFVGSMGPFGIGKSLITDEVLRLFPAIQPILSTTTRARKPEDPAGFKTATEGVTFQTFEQAARRGELVNFSVIPGGDIYGTFPEDFPGRYTIGPFLPTGIDHVQKAGFERAHFAYIVLAGNLWRKFIEKSRRNMPSDRFTSRVKESISSTTFALENLDSLVFVENHEGEEGIHSAAQKIGHLVLDGRTEALDTEGARHRLEEMLTVAKDLQS